MTAGGPVFALLCDRCGHSYRMHELTPLCLPCAVGADAAEHRGEVPRPMSVRELRLAASSVRNHPPRRRGRR